MLVALWRHGVNTVNLRAFVPILALGIAGCAASQPRGGGPATAPAADASATSDKPDTESLEDELADALSEREKLQRELAISREKVAQCEATAAVEAADNADALARATAAQALSADKLRHLESADAPARVDAARLRLQEATDGLQEAREELAQLEEMYKETELADKTREIVIQRTKRRLARAEWSLRNQTLAVELLEKQKLPLEIADGRKQLNDDSRAVEQQKRKNDLAGLAKKIELLSARSEVARVESELRKVERKIARLQRKIGEQKPKA